MAKHNLERFLNQQEEEQNKKKNNKAKADSRYNSLGVFHRN